MNVWLSHKKLPSPGFIEQWQNKQTIHYRLAVPVSTADVLISQLSGSNA